MRTDGMHNRTESENRLGFAQFVALMLCVAVPGAGTLAQVPGQNQPKRLASTQDADARDDTPPGIAELIKNLDPTILANLTGADVTVEIVGDQIILQGPEEAVATLELLIRGLDREIEPKELRVVIVTERDANEIARTVADALNNAWGTPNRLPEDDISITPIAANILLVAARPSDIEYVIDIIEQVDQVPDPLGKIELMSFPVKYRKASLVATELQEIIDQLRAAQGVSPGSSKLQIIPNNANNTITVTAREAERDKIQSLIDQLDVEPIAGWGEVKLTIFPLIHSEATELAQTLEDLLASTTGNDRDNLEEVIYRLRISKASPNGEITELPPIDLQKSIRIIPDTGTNSLIVATVEENVEPVAELIRLMDGVPMGEALGVKVFPLRFADAETVSTLLGEMFDDGKNLPEDPDGSGADAVPEGTLGEALVYNIGLTADLRTNTLIVTGRQEQLALVEMIVTELDRPARGLKFPLRFIQLDHTDATRVGEIITELFDQRFEATEATGAGRAALERERVFLSVDIRSNSLIISASEENYEEIVLISGQLDTIPAKLFDQIRILNCVRVSAADMKTKIEELWQRKAELRRQEEVFEDIPVIVVDERSNALIIASSVEDFEEIERLIATLEAQPLIDVIRMLELEFSDAMVLATMLDELFEGIAGQSETFQAPTILPDPRSNALVVAGTQDAMERAVALVKRLDVPAGPQTAMFKVYPLAHVSATTLAERMQELFDSRQEGIDIPKTPIVILPEESSNSLICSASRDDHQVIVDLLGLLDSPSNLAKQFEIFPLKMAKVSTVAEKLESLFQAQGQGSGGRTDAIAVEADERTNSIIVWASPSQMENIRDVIRRLDTSRPAVEMMVKVIQLRQALAEDFAELLRATLVGDDAGSDDERAIIVSFLETHPDGRQTVRKLLRQDIVLEADPRTNSLMVMAPVDSMDMLEAMIRDFDRIRPVTSEIRLFPLVNSDAETMVDQLTDLFDPDTGGGDGETVNQLVFGSAFDEMDFASVGQQLRFASDPRTNTLLVAGAEVYLRMVEELVTYLDAQEAEDRILEVYNVHYRDAGEIATAVAGFVQQEQDILGDGDDEESRMRRMERQISVESVGQEGEGSSKLLVGTSRRMYQQTMDLIQSLDRPEPQVMISVLIAEVSLSDSAELGIEIAGQDLHFTEDAILGPNGVIQGSAFDYALGTALGAAPTGLGGLNFTVTGEDFSFLLHALQQDSRLEVLSRPVLLVSNGEEGLIEIADEIPFVESSQINDTGSTNSIIGRESVGVILTATPHISPDGYVTIAISQEISNFSGENLQLTEGVSSPIISRRLVETNVTVRDGETVVIGGLITSQESEGESKVPILGDLPFIGAFFRTTKISSTKTELLLVMTVDVLRTDEDVYNMSVEQRDKFVMPDSIRQSPLMEGLRIMPQDSSLGPVSKKTNDVEPKDALPPERQGERRKPLAPQHKTYGPVISRPASIRAPADNVYGPKITTVAARIGD